MTVVDRPSYDDKTVRGGRELIDQDGKSFTVESHAECPGHAAYIESGWRGLVTVYVCTDWKGNGHADHRKPQATPEAEREARRQVIANNKAWRSAEAVRREFLTTLLARKTAPKGAAAFVAAELARGSHGMRKAMERSPQLAASLLGAEPSSAREGAATLAEQATEGRARVITLALVLAGYEAETGPHTWRNPAEDMRRYFAFLAANGYQLSDVEQLVTQTKKPAARKRRAGSTAAV